VTLAAAAGAVPGATASTGGSFPSLAPIVSGVQCRAACANLDAATGGSVVRVSGRRLAGASRVIFRGRRGPRDDVTARPKAAAATRLDVVVPRRAHGGPLAVVNADGAVSRPSRAALPIARRGRSRLGADARLDRRVVFAGSRDGARFVFLVQGGQPQPARVDLVRVSDGKVVRRWTPGTLPAGTPRTIAWNGVARGAAEPGGRYQFRLYIGPEAVAPATLGGGATSSRGLSPVVASSFTLVSDVFPIRGPHGYGGGAGRFGAPRAGHIHQGQDVFAPCGTPLVAAHGGVVRYKAFQSAAGHYVVIRGAGTGLDYVYMHMTRPALVRKGQEVHTGEPIGYVGDTGDAQGCHLHFELWRAPGWYSGGAPFDPLPTLRAWDRLT
jgi:murein DD-endopeptidase MepM/ murein hydrolase activator NlpD